MSILNDINAAGKTPEGMAALKKAGVNSAGDMARFLQNNPNFVGSPTGDPRLAKQNKRQVFEQGLGDLGQNFQQTQQMFSPYMQQGQQAFNQQAALSGAQGAEAQQQAYSQFQSSPGQQFLQQQAEKALLRNAAATGQLGGGNTQSALQQQAIGFASQDFDNYYNRLGGVSQAGLGLTGQLGQTNANMGSNIASLYGTRLGMQKPPSNTMHGGDYLSAAAGFAGGILSDIRLKTDINHMGNINGINIYNWKWNEDAEKLGLKGREYGVIAQEIKEINPDAVHDGDYLSIDLVKVSKMLS